MIEIINKLNFNVVAKQIFDLEEGTLTLKQLHNKKYYAKTSKNLKCLLESIIAEEIFKYKRFDDE